MDEVPYGGVVTAVCDSNSALAPVNRTVRCVFDPAADQYRLLGDSLECAGACVTAECAGACASTSQKSVAKKYIIL